MAISDDKTGRCGVRGKSGGVLEAAARRTIFALETEAQDEMDDEGGGRVFVSLECKDGNEDFEDCEDDDFVDSDAILVVRLN